MRIERVDSTESMSLSTKVRLEPSVELLVAVTVAAAVIDAEGVPIELDNDDEADEDEEEDVEILAGMSSVVDAEPVDSGPTMFDTTEPPPLPLLLLLLLLLDDVDAAFVELVGKGSSAIFSTVWCISLKAENEIGYKQDEQEQGQTRTK